VLNYREPGFAAIRDRMLRLNPRNPYWRTYDGIKSLYDNHNKRFLSGLLPKVGAYLTERHIDYVITYTQSPIEKTIAHEENFELDKISLWDYQREALIQALSKGRGVIQIGTGGGKTEVAIALVKALGKRTLFLTHRIQLLNQTANRFVDSVAAFKGRVGIIGDGQYDPNFITIAMVQTLASLAKHKDKCSILQEDLAEYEVLIIDEAHRMGADQFHEVAGLVTNAGIRIGLTATPFMSGNPHDDMCLRGVTGDVICRVSASELIERGVLAQPLFKFIEINSPPIKAGRDEWRKTYEEGIVFNKERNQIIITAALQLNKMGKKTLIITQETTHADILQGLAGAQGLRTITVSGKDDHFKRQAALKDLSAKKIDAIIATNIFDEGIDVQDISGVIMASGQKSAPAFFQRTGRAIRRKEEDNYAVIIDFIDNQHPLLLHHSEHRMSLIKQEPLFRII
jgi:superfamily II DNA or RNA helicase